MKSSQMEWHLTVGIALILDNNKLVQDLAKLERRR
jgi:hypothetical protein